MSEADVEPEEQSGNYWTPGVRLSSRVEAPRRTPTPVASRRPWWIAAVIIIGALIIAVALWLTALWAQNRDTDAPETANAPEAAHAVATRLEFS